MATIVGLTGGFGTGKSFVASIFRKLGARVIDADKLAHESLKKGSATYNRIIEEFGGSILEPDGSVNRKALGRVVFDDKERLARLNGIIHPDVIGKIKKIIDVSRDRVLIIDAPLVCETEVSDIVDLLIVVKASKKTQIDRCVKKFKIKKDDVSKRAACQMPLKEKVSKADYVIDNDGTRKETEKQVKKVWQDLKKGEIVWR